MIIALVDQGGISPPLEECLCVDDDILRLSGTAMEKLMKQWLKAYYLFFNIYIALLCVGEKLACLRTIAKKPALTQNIRIEKVLR